LLLATDFPIDTLLPGKHAVMAIGTDSLELVRHPPRPQRTRTTQAAAGGGGEGEGEEEGGGGGGAWLDLCCGSGVQGLSAVAWGRCEHATCVDINPRAVHFTVANALLNSIPVTDLANPIHKQPRPQVHQDDQDQDGESDRSSGWSGSGGRRRRGVTVLEGDLYAPLTATADAAATAAAAAGAAGAAGHGQEKFTAVLANPPFVAVPSGLADLPLHAAWALFAAGGPAGDEVLRRIVEGAADYLEPTGGWLGIVTEIPNVKQTGTWLVPLLSSATGAAEQMGDADKIENEIPPPAGRATGSSGGSGGGGDIGGDRDDDANNNGGSKTGSRGGMLWESAVVFGAGDVVCAEDYSAIRAAERGWSCGSEAARAWERGMEDHQVDDMTSALFYACIRRNDSDDGIKELLECDDSGSGSGSGSGRGGFDLREYVGEDCDFMAGDGAAFVETTLQHLVNRQQQRITVANGSGDGRAYSYHSSMRVPFAVREISETKGFGVVTTASIAKGTAIFHECDVVEQVRKRHFLRHLYIKCII
jgi:16S rRNA G966 N2-methylase RsmD